MVMWHMVALHSDGVNGDGRPDLDQPFALRFTIH